MTTTTREELLTQLAQALDALPERRLGTLTYIDDSGLRCAVGALQLFRSDDWPEARGDWYLHDEIAKQNDCVFSSETPEARWHRMRAWVDEQLTKGESDAD